MATTPSRFSDEPLGKAAFWPMLAILAVVLVGATPAPAQYSSVWQGSQWHLWRIDVDGTHLMPLDQTPGSHCGSPDWSPDGKHIAYDCSCSSSGAQIVVIRPDGTDRRLLGSGGIPAWSPDGELIAFMGGEVMNADGTGRETLPGGGEGLRWWPRGDRIAVNGGGIWLFDLASGKRSRVFSGPSVFHGFDVSPDGRRICFGSPGQGVGLATLDPKTMQASVRWLVTGGDGWRASWAPDGRHVVFAWQSPSSTLIQIYTMDVDANEPPTLLPGLDNSHHNAEPDWSPDGKTIVFSCPAPLEFRSF